MRHMGLAMACLVALVLTGCRNGGSGQGTPSHGDPTGKESHKNPSLHYSVETVIAIHAEMLHEQAATTLSAQEWRCITGWKLYQRLATRGLFTVEDMEDPGYLRVLLRLHHLLIGGDGRVFPVVDAEEITNQLLNEYKM